MKTKGIIKVSLVLTLLIVGTQVKADNLQCKKQANCNLSHVIPEYRKKLAQEPVDYAFFAKKTFPEVELNQYKMTSQSWSPEKIVTPEKWLHDLDIYIPKNAKKYRALMVVNDGTNNNDLNKRPSNFSEEMLANIARQTKTIVISVSNIPNQPLIYQHDSVPVREDDSVAKSWNLFMEQPEKRMLLPLHVPMAVSASQAMRVAKKELSNWDIQKFMVTGASKRGWSTWLTAISDTDVEAIIPFVNDLLNIDVTLEHMHRTYGGNWPIAFSPYYAQNIDTSVKTGKFSKLLEIEDPFRYMNSIYKDRLAIPKYIINASGDDFYVPDNTRFYYDKLVGSKSLRVAPNTDHRGILNFAEQSLISFINRYQSKKSIVLLKSKVENKSLKVEFLEKPKKIIRWTAINTQARDFRYACGIRYESLIIDVPANNKLDIPLAYAGNGWESTFVEATFSDGYVATTQAYITPDELYVNMVPPSNGGACQTLPGRGLG